MKTRLHGQDAHGRLLRAGAVQEGWTEFRLKQTEAELRMSLAGRHRRT